MSEASRSDDPKSIASSGEAGPSQDTSPEAIEGLITRIKWPRTGHHAGEDIGAVVNDVTVIGVCDVALRLGDRIQASGGRIGSSKWGLEFRAASIAVLPPVEHDAQFRMLQMERVTPQTARKLVDHFG